MLREIRDLGFQYAELSHGTRISLLPGILEAVDAGEMRISSLHNFCPLPMGVNYAAPNLYQFSAERPRERELAQRYTVKTIEFAARVKAPAVVLHSGSIDMKNYTDKLLDLAGRGEKETPKYAKLCAEVDEKREAKKGPFVERAERIAEEAAARGRIAGHQAGDREPPGAGGTAAGNRFPVPVPRTGQPERGVLARHGPRARSRRTSGSSATRCIWSPCATGSCGLHIHDVQFPGRDHCAPGTGMIDFAALKPLIKPEHIKVFELSPSLTVEEVKSGVAHVKRIWGEE